MFPNVDQRLELFLLKVLPHCKELRISLTIDNNENYYNVKRVEGNELMCLKGMNGESVYNILKKYLININQLNLEELNYNEDSPWDNGRQVFLLKIKGYLN